MTRIQLNFVDFLNLYYLDMLADVVCGSKLFLLINS
jgi:hypothetical protein